MRDARETGAMPREPKEPQEPQEQPKNPLHGITLETIVTRLVERYGFETLGRKIRIRCFTEDPSVKSSLTFLRRTPWARERVESFYLYIQRQNAREGNKTA